jgi:cobalt-zinc-cadmium efflux system protein
VLAAFAITLLAAGIELAGSLRGGSLFLAADAIHLLAHLGIFGVLLIPTSRRNSVPEHAQIAHERVEDAVTISVLVLVLLIALGIAGLSLHGIAADAHEPPQPAWMLLACIGLAANIATACLLSKPARTFWSFRAALAHELSDGALTIVGLVGALFIKLLGWRWVDPALSLLIALWLGAWSIRLLAIRASRGRCAWETSNHCTDRDLRSGSDEDFVR